MKKRDNAARFWSHVDKSGDCWEWQKSLNDSGYGKFRIGGQSVRAHRYSYELTFGQIADELFVCHRCDNPKCVRPDHLFLGTCADNINDMMGKGRYVGNIAKKNISMGISHYNSKLTEADIHAIRQLHKDGKSYAAIGEVYGLNRGTIGDIVKRRTWKHVTD